jgi:hypothetical protein
MYVVAPSIFTVTASPSLLYEYAAASLILGRILANTFIPPLFIILLKDPVSRTISLYNHWYLQELQTGNGYSLSLEELVSLELDLLSRPYPSSLLNMIVESVHNETRVRAVLGAAASLRAYMEDSLQTLSLQRGGRLNLRSFGLVLDACYLIQLVGWTRSPHISLKRRLLIAKSEGFLQDREGFLRSHLLPFLFPHHDPSSPLPLSLPGIKNSKPVKHYSSSLSPALTQRLARFYHRTGVEAYLHKLQQRGFAAVIPPIEREPSGEYRKWW